MPIFESKIHSALTQRISYTPYLTWVILDSKMAILPQPHILTQIMALSSTKQLKLNSAEDIANN